MSYNLALQIYFKKESDNYVREGIIKKLYSDYETTLEVKTQSVSVLSCYQCDNSADTSTSTAACYDISNSKATSCPDLSYTSCFSTTAAYTLNGAEVFSAKRGCSKDAAGTSTGSDTSADGLATVQATTTVCTTTGCNKAKGPTVSTQTAGTVAAEDSASDESSDTGAEAAAEAPAAESGAKSLLLSVSLLFFTLINFI